MAGKPTGKNRNFLFAGVAFRIKAQALQFLKMWNSSLFCCQPLTNSNKGDIVSQCFYGAVTSLLASKETHHTQ